MRKYLLLSVFMVALLLFCPGIHAGSLEEQYDQAQSMISEGRYAEAAEILSGITGYEDASMLCMYARACDLAESGEYESALLSFESLDGFRDSNLQTIYYTARQYEDAGMTEEALEAYRSIAAFRDSLSRIKDLEDGETITNTSDYWPQNISEDQIDSYTWSLDPEDLSIDGDSLSVLSVSPSGQYIAVADCIALNIDKVNAAGVANPFGRLPDAIYLFSKEGEHYYLYKTIPIDTESQEELSSLLGGGSAFAWNDEETRIVITGDWGTASGTMQYLMSFHTNLYVLEVEEGTFRCLTGNEEPGEHTVLVKWAGADTIRYIKMSDDGVWQNALCEMEIATGSEKKLADLYNAEGRVSPIYSWAVSGDQIYYTVDGTDMEYSGFFKSLIGGSETDAVCLINLLADLRETDRHPYCTILELCSPGISADGRWACLSAYDKRVMNMDIPLADADAPMPPQNDPAHAVSITGLPWVPCHNIFLYDLETEQLVDPFTDEALLPIKVIVTGACFAPDGKSLLCTVFGDGGPWTSGDLNRTTFYQVNLTDGKYTAVRVYETDQISSVRFFNGFRWMENNILCIPTGMPPTYPVQMIKPAVFTQYPE